MNKIRIFKKMIKFKIIFKLKKIKQMKRMIKNKMKNIMMRKMTTKIKFLKIKPFQFS